MSTLSAAFKSVFLVIEDHQCAEPTVLAVCRNEDTAEWLDFKDEESEQDSNAGCGGKLKKIQRRPGHFDIVWG